LVAPKTIGHSLQMKWNLIHRTMVCLHNRGQLTDFIAGDLRIVFETAFANDLATPRLSVSIRLLLVMSSDRTLCPSAAVSST
jgi:hypothetical protein